MEYSVPAEYRCDRCKQGQLNSCEDARVQFHVRRRLNISGVASYIIPASELHCVGRTDGPVMSSHAVLGFRNSCKVYVCLDDVRSTCGTTLFRFSAWYSFSQARHPDSLPIGFPARILNIVIGSSSLHLVQTAGSASPNISCRAVTLHDINSMHYPLECKEDKSMQRVMFHMQVSELYRNERAHPLRSTEMCVYPTAAV